MNVTCSICAELLRNSDANDLQVTRCGHLFHNACLSQWLDRKSTCPECRSKSTKLPRQLDSVIRLYLNIADSSYFENQPNAPDLVTLQSEADNLKFRLLEKDGLIKAKDEKLLKLEEENQKLKENQKKSRALICALEKMKAENEFIKSQHIEQIKHLRTRLCEIDQLKEKLKEADEKSRVVDMVQQVINGTQQETEDLLKEGRSMTELATMITTLKRELKNSNVKRTQLRNNVEDLSKQLRQSKEEKMTLEEKCSILESELENAQMKNISKCRNDSSILDKDNSSENIENLDDSVSVINTKKRTFDDRPAFPMRLNFKSELVPKTKSPSLNIKASSIAGLSPLLKRTKSAESYKLSPLSDDKNTGTLSIMKKPRLLQTHTKKSDLRPERLQTTSSSYTATSSSSMTGEQASSSQTIVPNPPPSTSSLGSKLGSLDTKRFRLGPLTKMP